MLDTETCDWCGRHVEGDDALFDAQVDPGTGHSRLVTACSEDHVLALARRAHRQRRTRRVAAGTWRMRRRWRAAL
jgi:hypothetical protein